MISSSLWQTDKQAEPLCLQITNQHWPKHLLLNLLLDLQPKLKYKDVQQQQQQKPKMSTFCKEASMNMEPQSKEAVLNTETEVQRSANQK